ncbi:MAG: aspartate dehydrogenase [Acidiferrobacterales bacterium]
MTQLTQVDALQVAIGGLGTVGTAVARRLDQGIESLTLAAVSARDRARAAERMRDYRHKVPVLPLAELAGGADVIVECAPAAVFSEVAEPAVKAGRIFVPISVGALLSNWHIVKLARTHGARIIVPTGALLGLDAVRAAAEGRIDGVRMVTRKPPRALAGSPYIEEHAIGLDNVDKPLKVFEGTAREGAEGFPANVNVAAALGLAGVGPDRTRLEIWADPTVTRNTHHIIVEADSARFELNIENVPSDENPRTGKIVALSIIAALRRLVDPISIGT